MGDVSANLGRLMKYVRIAERGSHMIVVPTSDWIDKKYWRQINDILSLRGFVWVTDRQQWEVLPSK